MYLKFTSLLPCFQVSKAKKPRGKRLTIDAAIFKVDVVIWSQAVARENHIEWFTSSCCSDHKKEKIIIRIKSMYFFAASNY